MCIEGKECIFAKGCFVFCAAAAGGSCSEAGKWCGAGSKSDCFGRKLALFFGLKKPRHLQMRNLFLCAKWFGQGCGFNVHLSCRVSSGFTRTEGYGMFEQLSSKAKNIVGGWMVYLRVFCNGRWKVDNLWVLNGYGGYLFYAFVWQAASRSSSSSWTSVPC